MEYVYLDFRPKRFAVTWKIFDFALQKFEKDMQQSPETPKFLGATIWHMDGIAGSETIKDMVWKLWTRILVLINSPNPKNFHLVYCSGVSNILDDAGRPPTLAKWIPLEPFSAEDINELFTKFIYDRCEVTSVG